MSATPFKAALLSLLVPAVAGNLQWDHLIAEEFPNSTGGTCGALECVSCVCPLPSLDSYWDNLSVGSGDGSGTSVDYVTEDDWESLCLPVGEPGSAFGSYFYTIDCLKNGKHVAAIFKGADSNDVNVCNTNSRPDFYTGFDTSGFDSGIEDLTEDIAMVLQICIQTDIGDVSIHISEGHGYTTYGADYDASGDSPGRRRLLGGCMDCEYTLFFDKYEDLCSAAPRWDLTALDPTCGTAPTTTPSDDDGTYY